MKYKLFAIPLLTFLFTSCASSKPQDEDKPLIKTLVLDAGFVFDSGGDNTATLLYNESYYSFPSDIKLDVPLVAGDQLYINFDGEYEVICDESYPSRCEIKGKIASYSLNETLIQMIPVDELVDGYLLDNQYAILDEEGRYVSLDTYEGNELYISENLKKKKEYCNCPDGVMCDPCPIYVAGLYAYNPRI